MVHVLMLLLACLKTSPPPPGLTPGRIAGLGEAPEGCGAVWVVKGRTEVCATPCLKDGEVYAEGQSEPMPRKEGRCFFHQATGDHHGSWVVEASVPLVGRHACVTETGEWIALDLGEPRSTPGVESWFGTGTSTVSTDEGLEVQWSRACAPADGAPLLAD